MLTIQNCNKLQKLIPLLASDQRGEVVATVEAIKRVLKSDNSDFNDLSKALTTQQNTNTEVYDQCLQLQRVNNGLSLDNARLQTIIYKLQQDLSSANVNIRQERLTWRLMLLISTVFYLMLLGLALRG